MARILVLNGSSRARGFTAAMIRSFEQGARQAGNTVQVLDLRTLDIHCCVGCLHGGADPAHSATTWRPSTRRTARATWWRSRRRSSSGRTAACSRTPSTGCGPLRSASRTSFTAMAGRGRCSWRRAAATPHLMLRMGWKNLGSAVLLHTDDLDPAAVTDVPQAHELGASIA